MQDPAEYAAELVASISALQPVSSSCPIYSLLARGRHWCDAQKDAPQLRVPGIEAARASGQWPQHICMARRLGQLS